LIVSTGFAVIRPRELVPAFAAYALLAPYFVERVVANSVGVSFPAINPNDLGCFPIARPNHEEQRNIAAFLNRETTKIDALIAQKEQLIELLQAKRVALITHAVTKGLDPNIRMKSSGVEWLGVVPSHWKVRRLKDVIFAIEQGWSPLCENRTASDDEWGVLKVGCVNGVEFDEREHKALPAEVRPRPEYEIRPGDILMSRANTRQLLASAALVRTIRPMLLLCDKLYRIKLGVGTLVPEFLIYILTADASRFYLEREATGASSSMLNIAQETIATLPIATPPLDEQSRIVRFLEEQTDHIAELVKTIRSAIDHLKEYRTALISAAVTGKIDAREETP
jgi:type I restriction enzyme S subunit